MGTDNRFGAPSNVGDSVSNLSISSPTNFTEYRNNFIFIINDGNEKVPDCSDTSHFVYPSLAASTFSETRRNHDPFFFTEPV